MKMLFKDILFTYNMEYIYIGKISIIEKIEFKDYLFSEEKHNNELLDELLNHIYIYIRRHNMPQKIILDDLKSLEINTKIFMCEKTNEGEFKLLVSIIFLTKTKIIIQGNEIETENGTIIIFPAEWFFYFELYKSRIIVGYIYEFKE